MALSRILFVSGLSAALCACSGARNPSEDYDILADAGSSIDIDAGSEADAALEADASTAPEDRAVINELYKKQPGDDVHEFVEIYGAPNTDYSALSIVILESDGDNEPGEIDIILEVGTTDANGFYLGDFLFDQIENGANTFLLVEGLEDGVAAGDDLDENNDGTLDLEPWDKVVDGVALLDDPIDVAYSNTSLAPLSDGIADEYDGASRVPDGKDTGATADWLRSNTEGDGLQGIAGAEGMLCADCGAVAGESGTARLTPGSANSVLP